MADFALIIRTVTVATLKPSSPGLSRLVPAISIRIAQYPIIGLAGTNPAMTKWDCREFCPCY